MDDVEAQAKLGQRKSKAKAGWYTDAHKAGQQRYWDGAKWADKVRQVPVPRPEHPAGVIVAGFILAVVGGGLIATLSQVLAIAGSVLAGIGSILVGIGVIAAGVRLGAQWAAYDRQHLS